MYKFTSIVCIDMKYWFCRPYRKLLQDIGHIIGMVLGFWLVGQRGL